MAEKNNLSLTFCLFGPFNLRHKNHALHILPIPSLLAFMINDDWFFRAMDQLDAMLIKILRFSLDATLFPLPLASERASNLAVRAPE